jgi:glycosyltransferase involved in cell wall biosynthesis
VTGGARVTAIVAARNEERRIAECLRSLLAQTHRPLEIVVVDDGSDDATAGVAEAVDPSVRVVRRRHGGKARAVWAGAEHAGGEILLFLDADMVFEPDYVARLIAPIVAGAEVGTAHGTELVANPGNRWAACWQRHAGRPPDRRFVLSEAQLAAGSTVFRAVRAADFRRVGGFDDVGYHDDQTLCPKLGRRAKWVLEARCRHYNVETLAEVAALGAWGARSVWAEHGRRALVSFAPPLAALHAVRDAVRYRSLAMAIYTGAYEWGLWRGLRRLRRGPA